MPSPRREPRISASRAAPPVRVGRLPSPPSAPGATPGQRWPGLTVWVGVLAGAWVERLVGSLPAGLQSFADLGLAFGTAAVLMLAFRRVARRRVTNRREASDRAAARAPGSAGTS